MKQLAERRTDIFGVGDEETAIGKKIGEEDRRKDDKVCRLLKKTKKKTHNLLCGWLLSNDCMFDQVTWDGHTSSVEAATRAARANITLEEQIHQIHKVRQTRICIV